MRKLIGFCCGAAVLAGSLIPVLRAEAPASETSTAKSSGGIRLPDSSVLVHEVVYNELHDHDAHGYWRFWVKRSTSKETVIREQIETPAGPIERVALENGRPVDASLREEEDRRLDHLLHSPSEQAQHLKDYQEDERRIGRILALLPDAFLYDPAEVQMTEEGPCYHMRFHPNPNYPAHSIEARIFHAMTGELWVSVNSKRMVRLDGRLQENVDFGYGILGRLYKDGWFQLVRTRVSGSAGNGDWKTSRLEVHMNGRAMLFKTIARETSEVRGGFTPVPTGLSLQQAATLIQSPVNGSLSESRALPAALVTNR